MTRPQISRLSKLVRARLAESNETDRSSGRGFRERSEPPALPARWKRAKKKPRFVVGVSTFNRIEYLRKFVETFDATRESDYESALIVADDGSSDGTVDYLLGLDLDDVLIIKIFNRGARIAGQTNSILLAADALEFDFGIMCDDDVFFESSGWASGYATAAESSGFDHLVFHDEGWKAGDFAREKGDLVSHVRAENAMGCLWTFSPSVIEDVGFFDERAFPVRGHSHLDYTFRASRLGHNEVENLWDWSGAERHIRMWPREEYVETIDWSSPLVKSALSPGERARRDLLVKSPDRTHRPFDPLPGRPLPIVECTEDDSDLRAALALRGFSFRARGQLELYDQAFVLNLPHQLKRWKSTASALSSAVISFRRADTVNGYDRDMRLDWEAYAAAGIEHPHERTIGRKLIQSPGAWGYLSSADRVIEEARGSRFARILMFDDDIKLSSGFEDRLNEVLRELPNGWKLLYLGASYDDISALERRSPHLVDPGSQVNGSFAVAFGADSFDTLQESIAERTWPFDSGPLRDLRMAHPHSVFAARPELVLPDVTASSIRESRDQDHFARRMGWDLSEFQPSLLSGPRLSVLIWGGPDALALRETLVSLRYQRHGWFDAYVVVANAWVESIEIAMEARKQDPRVVVLSVETTDSIEGLGAAEGFVADTPVVHLHGGDILFPDHLESLVSLSDGEVARVPGAVIIPRGSVVAGQLGVGWAELRDTLAVIYGVAAVPTRAIIGAGAREMVGDLPAWADDVFGRILHKALPSVEALARPTMVAVVPDEPPSATRAESPFFISPGRGLDAEIRGGPESAGQITQPS